MAKKKTWIYVLTVLGFAVYAAWMLGPYLRSVIVRDASVTTWSRTAVASIAGRIVTDLPEAGALIGQDGHIAIIRNEFLLLETQAVEKTRDRVIALRSQINEAEEYLDDLVELDKERIAIKEQHIAIFRDQLKIESGNLRSEIKISAEQIVVLRRIVKRHRSLVGRGAGSAASLDEALLRVTEEKARQSQLNAALRLVVLRERSANSGVYITPVGETPDWVRQREFEIQLDLRRTRHDLHAATIAFAEAERDMVLEQKTLQSLTQATVTAPPVSLVYSVLAAPDSTLAVGDPILEWIDCSQLMVDVPVSDAELPLILRGASAEVVLEGESRAHKATVLLTRGSSATLGRADLAAIAKGRKAGVAQVLLVLDADREEFDLCPVGRAAYVEFPGVGLIDIIRARLRL